MIGCMNNEIFRFSELYYRDVNSQKGWIIENCLRFQENSNSYYSVDTINNCTEKNKFSGLYL